MLSLGNKAPAFTLLDQDRKEQTLAEHVGQWVLVYFYPKDDTPGCTKEACIIAEVYDEFQKLGVMVFGVSKDTPASHKKFAIKYHLPFTLLSDPEMETIKAYDAFKPKKMFGKDVRGTHRISYLIDPEGNIAKAYPKVDPATHAREILQDMNNILQETE